MLQSEFYKRWIRVLTLLVAWWIPTFGNCTVAKAEEPYQRFLQKLRDERLYELALVYIDDLASDPNVPAKFKSEIPFERGLLLYNAAAGMPARNPQRAAKLDQAEKALRDFLGKGAHPRRGEARLALGNLLLTRAEEAVLKAEPDYPATRSVKQDVPEAIKFYGDAHALFEDTIKELAGILDGLKGARVDPKDTEKVAYRDRLRNEVRQAQLFSASAMENRGRSRKVDGPDWKKDLEQALQMYSDLYMKEKEIIGIRNYALFYRSGIQKSLGKVEDAADGYQRIVDHDPVDLLRGLQTEAVTELIKLLAAQGKYPVAVEQAEKWSGQLRPDERNRAETVVLKIEDSKIRLAWAVDLEKKDKDDKVASRLRRDTRETLRGLLRIPGDHLEEVRSLLGQLGVEQTTKTVEVPKVKDFSEALAAATQHMQDADTEQVGIEVLLEQVAKAGDEQAKAELESKLKEARTAVERLRSIAIQLLREAVRRYTPSDDLGQLFEARQRLAYNLLRSNQPWEAVAVAEFLANSNPRADNGLRAAAIALAGYSELFKSEDEAYKLRVMDQFQPFATYLVETWPESEEAGAAAAALVQLALVGKHYDQAEEFLKSVPESSATGSKLRRDAGLTFYAVYLDEKRKGGEGDELNRLKVRAVRALESAKQAITPDAMGSSDVEVVNALVRMYLMDDQLKPAADLLFTSPVSPINALKAKADIVSPRIAMDTYRTALQTVISQLASGGLANDAATKQMQEYVAALEAVAAKEPQGAQTLGGIYVQLAQDLNTLLASTKDAAKRKKLAEAMVMVTTNAGQQAKEFNTKYWAADTLLGVAEELARTSGSFPESQAAYAGAAKILEAIVTAGKENPDWMQPKGIELQVHLLLARSHRGRQQFKEAIDELANVLTENNAMLDVQMEAAKTYQAWAEAKDYRFHQYAMLGSRPQANRQNLIWGWGKIASAVINNPTYTDKFFEARYQLAVSRLGYAKGQTDAALKTQYLKQAAKDVQSTAQLFPELGGPAMKKKYSGLLQQIQTALGEEPVGLKD